MTGMAMREHRCPERQRVVQECLAQAAQQESFYGLFSTEIFYDEELKVWRAGDTAVNFVTLYCPYCGEHLEGAWKDDPSTALLKKFGEHMADPLKTEWRAAPYDPTSPFLSLAQAGVSQVRMQLLGEDGRVLCESDEIDLTTVRTKHDVSVTFSREAALASMGQSHGYRIVDAHGRVLFQDQAGEGHE